MSNDDSGMNDFEKALIKFHYQMHNDLIKEVQTLRKQMLGLVVLLVVINAALKGIDVSNFAALVLK